MLAVKVVSAKRTLTNKVGGIVFHLNDSLKCRLTRLRASRVGRLYTVQTTDSDCTHCTSVLLFSILSISLRKRHIDYRIINPRLHEGSHNSS